MTQTGVMVSVMKQPSDFKVRADDPWLPQEPILSGPFSPTRCPKSVAKSPPKLKPKAQTKPRTKSEFKRAKSGYQLFADQERPNM